MNIGIFGGSFNPIHFGHLRTCEELIEGMPLDKIIFIPSNITSNKNETAKNSKNRFEMVKIAIKDNPKFETSDIEIKMGGISFSYNTIKELKKKYPDDELFFIIGFEAFTEIRNWKNSPLLFEMTNFIIINRDIDAKTMYENLAAVAECIPDTVQNKITADIALNRLMISRENKLIILFEVTKLDISSTKIRNNFKKKLSNRFLLPNDIIEYIINNNIYM
ncbi:MAG: nicotinate-nucleotide adenylyltransferase [bacterium]